MNGFALSVGWPAGTLESPGFQNLSTQDLETKTTRIPLCGFDQPIQRLSVGIAHGMIEIGKDGFVPVVHSSQQSLRGLSLSGC
jgi:hypothetical protein